MMTLKPPLRARVSESGVWIEDAAGITIFDANPLLVDEFADELLDLAWMMAAGPELLDSLRELNSMLFHLVKDKDADHPALLCARKIITKASRKEV